MGGVLLILLVLVGWSMHRLEQAVGGLHAVLPFGVGSDHALLERQLLRAAERAWAASGLLAVTAILLSLLYQRNLARRDRAKRDARTREDTYRQLIEQSQSLQLIREQQARREAEAAARLKDEFLATVSHELRMPLTAILGWATFLASRELDRSKTKKALETIVRNARTQARLINDILDASRISTDKLNLELRRIELVPVIEAAIQAVRPAAEASQIQLDCSLDAATGAVSGDAARLEQVVWNLLANAVKFTPPGGQVKVELRPVGSRAQITVSDTGSGIRPEFLPFAFERFRQDGSLRTKAQGGLGLGLAIVRDLVERHGGTIRAKSRGEDQGATFVVELPLLEHEQEGSGESRAPMAVKNDPPPGASAALSGVRVLVVEDHPDSRELLQTVLVGAGAEVSAAASVREAMETMQQLKPDVLVSEIEMADEDGYTLIRRVRELGAERGGQVRAAALTAYARSEDRAEALRAGFQAQVTKPIDVNELVSVVANLAETTRSPMQ